VGKHLIGNERYAIVTGDKVKRDDRVKRKGNGYAQPLPVYNSEVSTSGNSNSQQAYITNGFMVEV
jgi:hypothetical protein